MKHPQKYHRAFAPTDVISLVVPMFNEQEVLDILFERLGIVLDDIGQPYEIICVDDGSTDETARLLCEKAEENKFIRILTLSRNFGKEVALTAGLDHANGLVVIPLDADLQDPPELIPQFLQKWREGYDVVIGVRNARVEDTSIKRVTARTFYSVLNTLSSHKIPSNAGDFRLMDRRVILALRRYGERNRFMKGLFSSIGFKQTQVLYDRPKRAAGTTKFNYWRLWNFALDGITGYSTLPLRVSGYLGILLAIFSGIFGIYLIIRTLIWEVDVPGYASIMVTVLFIGGFQLIILGVMGEYIGRMYSETKRRPLYIIDQKIGFEDTSGALLQSFEHAELSWRSQKT